MSFRNRWRISGTLTTTSALHIGSGRPTERAQIKDQHGRACEINAVAADCHGAAYIPGSTLKGNLRGWLEQNGADPTLAERVFGVMDTNNPERRWGGKAEFTDAFFARDTVSSRPALRWWDGARKTCVAPGVAIDPHTRTADDEKLFYHEFVPPGVEFNVEIGGRDLEDPEVDLLLAGLLAMDLPGGPKLGAGTADGWGRMSWRLDSIERSDALAAWLAGKADCFYVKLDHSPYVKRANALLQRLGGGSSLAIDLGISFDSHFLVNDPSQCGKDGLPDHAPVTENGQIVLPASSIRGAFRSQAERILKTIFPDEVTEVRSVEGIEDVRKLPRFCQLFGATGWRSPVHFTDFRPDPDVPDNQGVEQTQDFVAIDRFTGGGEEGKKFNARSSYRPVLRGSLRVDLDALDRAGAGPGALGLLALTFRDLLEGDITFGFGAAKGYGSCTVEVLGWELRGAVPARFLGPLKGGEWTPGTPMPAAVTDLLKSWVRELHAGGAQ